jgi:very-short-patch-repair endonuclease
MREDPEFRQAQAERTKGRWRSGVLREQVVRWHRDNKELSNQLIANARKHGDPRENLRKARLVQVKTSKLHLFFKEQMILAGLTGFVTEGLVGPFQVDEANYALKVAVEIDGCWWHGCSTCGYDGVRSTLNNDKSKNAYLKAMNWAVLRLKGHEIDNDPEGCLERITSFVSVSREVTA